MSGKEDINLKLEIIIELLHNVTKIAIAIFTCFRRFVEMITGIVTVR